MPYGNLDVGQLWIRWWLVAWQPVSSHYLNLCWLAITGVLWHSPKNNFTSAQNINPKNKFENYAFRITATSPGINELTVIHRNQSRSTFLWHSLWTSPGSLMQNSSVKSAAASLAKWPLGREQQRAVLAKDRLPLGNGTGRTRIWHNNNDNNNREMSGAPFTDMD